MSAHEPTERAIRELAGLAARQRMAAEAQPPDTRQAMDAARREAVRWAFIGPGTPGQSRALDAYEAAVRADERARRNAEETT